MTIEQLKVWAKEKRDGHIKDILLPCVIIGLCSYIVSAISELFNSDLLSLLITFAGGAFIFILQVGYIAYMLDLIKGKDYKIETLWSKLDKYSTFIPVYLLQTVFVFLWSLLLIIPGVIKRISYSLVPYILADEDNTIEGMEVLRKSEEMMNGHKMDYFMLCLSFVGWHILAAFTFFILEIWIVPYQALATTKFLSDIMDENQGSKAQTVTEADIKEETTSEKCPKCGAELESDAVFCTTCGENIK